MLTIVIRSVRPPPLFLLPLTSFPGMGEIGAVLNGVHFLSRHNDYSLAMPVNASGPSNYHKVQNIPHPPVPPSVLNQTSLDGQIQEMRKYFEAFQKQDIKIRDYRPFFKPVLCVLEGAWILDSVSISEPFASDRHFIDAATWDQLNSLNMFLANSGACDFLFLLLLLLPLIPGQ